MRGASTFGTQMGVVRDIEVFYNHRAKVMRRRTSQPGAPIADSFYNILPATALISDSEPIDLTRMSPGSITPRSHLTPVALVPLDAQHPIL